MFQFCNGFLNREAFCGSMILFLCGFFLLKLDDRDFRLCIRKFAREYLLSTMLFFKVSIFPDQPAYIVLKIQLSIFRYINSEILHSYTVFPAIQQPFNASCILISDGTLHIGFLKPLRYYLWVHIRKKQYPVRYWLVL